MAAQKIIIDTDPGIDDAMAIHQAFADTRLEVIGLTTIFGNVYVNQATRNNKKEWRGMRPHLDIHGRGSDFEMGELGDEISNTLHSVMVKA